MEVGTDQAKADQTSTEGTEGQIEAGATENTVAEDIVRRDTHHRVLKESQKYKQRALEAEQRLQAFEETKMKEQENFKGLAEMLGEKNKTLETQLAKLQMQTSLQPKLAEAGCVSIDDALKLGKQDLLVFDEGNLHGVEQYIEDLKESKPFLFSSKTPSSVNTQLPAGGLKVTPKEKDLSQMSAADIRSELASLGKQMAGKQ